MYPFAQSSPSCQDTQGAANAKQPASLRPWRPWRCLREVLIGLLLLLLLPLLLPRPLALPLRS